MNPDWLSSNRQARPGYSRVRGSPNGGWGETEPCMNDLLDFDAQYTAAPFDGPWYLPPKSTHVTEQHGHRGRPYAQAHSQSSETFTGTQPQATEPLGSPFDTFRAPTQQNGVNRSWLDLSSPEARKTNPASSLEANQESLKRAIQALNRRMALLEDKVARVSDYEGKFAASETRTSTVLANFKSKLVQLEKKLTDQLSENNEKISSWLQDLKLGMERFVGGDTRVDEGFGDYSKNDTWNEGAPGEDNEDQAMLSGGQSGTIDFLK